MVMSQGRGSSDLRIRKLWDRTVMSFDLEGEDTIVPKSERR